MGWTRPEPAQERKPTGPYQWGCTQHVWTNFAVLKLTENPGHPADHQVGTLGGPNKFWVVRHKILKKYGCIVWDDPLWTLATQILGLPVGLIFGNIWVARPFYRSHLATGRPLSCSTDFDRKYSAVVIWIYIYKKTCFRDKLACFYWKHQFGEILPRPNLWLRIHGLSFDHKACNAVFITTTYLNIQEYIQLAGFGKKFFI